MPLRSLRIDLPNPSENNQNSSCRQPTAYANLSSTLQLEINPMNMRTNPLQKSILALTAMLLLGTSGAFAGSKEVAAVNAKLPAGKTIPTATSAELTQAVKDAIVDQANKKLKDSAMAGEALKGAVTAGATISADLANALLDPAFVSNLGDKLKFLGGAALTASTGTAPNSDRVLDFASLFVATNGEAITAAKSAIKSGTAIGAIIGGRALDADVNTDQARLDLANAAIADKNLKKGIQEIARRVGDTVTNAPGFATGLSALQLKQITKIAPGVAASNPTQGDEIMDQLLGTTSTQGAAVKNASKLAGGLVLNAATEEGQKIVAEIGERIGTGLIKIQNLNKIAKSAVKSFVKKPTLAGADPIADSAVNVKDEIGEMGAYLVNAIVNHPDFDNIKKAPKIIVNLLKTIVKSSKIKTIASFQGTVAPDVSGSVAQTIFSINLNPTAFAPGVFDAIKNTLINPKTGKKIGKAFAAAITTALTEGINNTGGTKYEDGTIPGLGDINEPETDTRNI